ncbi:hypothetical protein K1719_025633 [Acacia pycnantha]|nr:hypothetical protein K1719_025633 [Acacia pycnantha]
MYYFNIFVLNRFSLAKSLDFQEATPTPALQEGTNGIISEHPPITISTLCGFLSLGLLGYLAQVFGYAGIYYSSATLSLALLNLVPGFTFILAVAFGGLRQGN